jgi:hypothetical protein
VQLVHDAIVYYPNPLSWNFGLINQKRYAAIKCVLVSINLSKNTLKSRESIAGIVVYSPELSESFSKVAEAKRFGHTIRSIQDSINHTLTCLFLRNYFQFFGVGVFRAINHNFGRIFPILLLTFK